MPNRPPIIAGQFYPANPDELRATISAYTKPVPQEPHAPLMLMLPHAGYMYCGRIIAETLAAVTLPGTVIMLGPNHTGRGAPLAVWPDGKWLTPLGPVAVDAELAEEIILSGNGFQADTEAHAFEHSLEVLLPFLLDKNPDIRIVPVAVALNSPQGLRQAAATLAGLIRKSAAAGKNISLLVSSDMNHFADQKSTMRKDALALERICALNPDGLLQTVIDEKISMCGVLPAVLALHAAIELGAQKAVMTAYGTSAEASGDESRVVGYAGVIIT